MASLRRDCSRARSLSLPCWENLRGAQDSAALRGMNSQAILNLTDPTAAEAGTLGQPPGTMLCALFLRD